MKLLCYLVHILWIIFQFQDLECVTIQDIIIPDIVVIENKEKEPQVLYCHYDLEEDSAYLVVKWFKDNDIAYQWIRGHKPSVFPNFKDDIDEDYVASTDPNKEYSALALIDPTIEDAGLYKCVVQTEKSTALMEKKLQVVDISNYTLNIFHHKMHNESHLECQVGNVYPEPTVQFATDDDIVSAFPLKVYKNEDGYYNATIVALANDDDIEEDIYTCIVTFANLPLNLTISTISGSSANEFSKIFTSLIIFFLLIRNDYYN